MSEKHLREHLARVLDKLSIPVEILSREDVMKVCALSADEEKRLSESAPRIYGRTMYLYVPAAKAYVRCNAQNPGAKDLLLMACELAAAYDSKHDAHMEDSFDVYRRMLLGELAGSELEALAHEYQLSDDMKRCVMVFHIVQTDNARAIELLQDITPLQEWDVLIDMDRHSVVLLKDMTDDDAMDDIVQFAQALQETLMGETAHQMTVGVGTPRHTLAELRESYMEARRAIEVGKTFKPEKNIYVYGRLILERFLMELPQDVSNYYHTLLFNRKNQRLFNEEMLYTIDMFFKKDLNLSDTARQLYIHRNTLVYRLDKVQKQTGLDLRYFEDAVTFKILMELKKVGGDRSNPRKS